MERSIHTTLHIFCLNCTSKGKYGVTESDLIIYEKTTEVEWASKPLTPVFCNKKDDKK